MPDARDEPTGILASANCVDKMAANFHSGSFSKWLVDKIPHLNDVRQRDPNY